MRWPLFAFAAYVALTLHVGLGPLLRIAGVSPDGLLILMVFIATWAGTMETLWAALALGLLADLTGQAFPVTQGSGDFVLIGPCTLGSLVGAFTVLQLRGLMFRDSPLAWATLVFLAGTLSGLIAVTILIVRTAPWLMDMPIPGWHASDQLVRSFGQSVYSALLAIPVGWLLRKTLPFWGFHTGKSRLAPR